MIRKVEKHSAKSKEDINTDEKNDNEEPKRNYKLFEYPALPFWETCYYFIVTFCCMIYGWYRVYEASRDYLWDGGWGIYEYGTLPFIGRRRQDVTNYEWRMYQPYIRIMLPWLFGHSLLFNVLEKIFGNGTVWSVVMLLYWVLAFYNIYGLVLLSMTLTCGIVAYTAMRLSRNKAIVWAVSVIMLYMTFNNPGRLPRPINYYSTIAFLAYKLVQYISYCMEECQNPRPENANFLTGLYNMFWYAFYLPYSNALIVLCNDFNDQIQNRQLKSREWSSTLFFGARILFWYCFVEFFLYIFYFNALMSDSEHLYTLRKDTLVSLGYAAGAMFFLKYVVIFGAPSFFAKLDNMRPQPGPICINRVTLYSKIWRQFDRGLYQFFKTYIFLPICRPTFSVTRKIIGVLVSYGFVLLWHGFVHHYVVWIILNIVELFLETAAKSVYIIPAVRQWIHSRISDRTLRRILAFLHLCPFAVGLYANFYFLTDADSGYVFVDQIFWKETVTFRYPFGLLLFFGYHYCNVCIDVERWISNRKRKNDLKES